MWSRSHEICRRTIIGGAIEPFLETRFSEHIQIRKFSPDLTHLPKLVCFNRVLTVVAAWALKIIIRAILIGSSQLLLLWIIVCLKINVHFGDLWPMKLDFTAHENNNFTVSARLASSFKYDPITRLAQEYIYLWMLVSLTSHFSELNLQ